MHRLCGHDDLYCARRTATSRRHGVTQLTIGCDNQIPKIHINLRRTIRFHETIHYL